MNRDFRGISCADSSITLSPGVLSSVGLSKLVQVGQTLHSPAEILAPLKPAMPTQTPSGGGFYVSYLNVKKKRAPLCSATLTFPPRQSDLPYLLLQALVLERNTHTGAHTHPFSRPHCIFQLSRLSPDVWKFKKQSPVPAARTLWMHVLQQLQGDSEGQGHRDPSTCQEPSHANSLTLKKLLSLLKITLQHDNAPPF